MLSGDITGKLFSKINYSQSFEIQIAESKGVTFYWCM